MFKERRPARPWPTRGRGERGAETSTAEVGCRGCPGAPACRPRLPGRRTVPAPAHVQATAPRGGCCRNGGLAGSSRPAVLSSSGTAAGWTGVSPVSDRDPGGMSDRRFSGRRVRPVQAGAIRDRGLGPGGVRLSLGRPCRSAARPCAVQTRGPGRVPSDRVAVGRLTGRDPRRWRPLGPSNRRDLAVGASRRVRSRARCSPVSEGAISMRSRRGTRRAAPRSAHRPYPSDGGAGSGDRLTGTP